MLKNTSDFVGAFAGEGPFKNAYQAQPAAPSGTESSILIPTLPKTNPYQEEHPLDWHPNILSSNKPTYPNYGIPIGKGTIHTTINKAATNVSLNKLPRSYPSTHYTFQEPQTDAGSHIFQANTAQLLVPPERGYHDNHDPKASIGARNSPVSTDPEEVAEHNRKMGWAFIGVLALLYALNNK
jgi:hypothetical protein